MRPDSKLWSRVYILSPLLGYVLGIDCYQCYSFNGMNEKCEDKFRTDVTTEHLIKRDCFYGYFRGTYCIKLLGTKKDGSTILVRDCSDNDWGRHCGDITFDFDNGKEDIKGCLETCDYDGCNSGNKLITNRHIIWIVSLFTGIILRM
ncbi:hypothetical protein CHS0354_039417 [Potamilus streckersoni]|uniref:Protein sleepless n=1 Tax=Potamilus streckersoni TaxID=2493646 RepID=A0AAE0S1E1_9BIVA|nr:hypothetical protein CHS0354_039417 [Potamilus streckersoni]